MSKGAEGRLLDRREAREKLVNAVLWIVDKLQTAS